MRTYFFWVGLSSLKSVFFPHLLHQFMELSLVFFQMAYLPAIVCFPTSVYFNICIFSCLALYSLMRSICLSRLCHSQVRCFEVFWWLLSCVQDLWKLSSSKLSFFWQLVLYPLLHFLEFDIAPNTTPKHDGSTPHAQQESFFSHILCCFYIYIHFLFKLISSQDLFP